MFTKLYQLLLNMIPYRKNKQCTAETPMYKTGTTVCYCMKKQNHSGNHMTFNGKEF